MIQSLLQKFFGPKKQKLSEYVTKRIALIRANYEKNPRTICDIRVLESGQEVYYILQTKKEAEVLLQSIENFEVELIEWETK